ncbi:hypothetical protein VNO77_03326 [Canavalia gladiata]|uniref:Uncharacterized protein n=1 Tax=Canavalia gladiata TaxID=3824 RepID=A0AAN9R6R0_CANGL
MGLVLLGHTCKIVSLGQQHVPHVSSLLMEPNATVHSPLIMMGYCSNCIGRGLLGIKGIREFLRGYCGNSGGSRGSVVLMECSGGIWVITRKWGSNQGRPVVPLDRAHAYVFDISNEVIKALQGVQMCCARIK